MSFPDSVFQHVPALKGRIKPPDESHMRLTYARFDELESVFTQPVDVSLAAFYNVDRSIFVIHRVGNPIGTLNGSLGPFGHVRNSLSTWGIALYVFLP